MVREEFMIKTANFVENYFATGRTIDAKLLKELNDYAVQTELYKSQKEKADFDDYSYDDVINHMVYKINESPLLAVFVCVLCIPFIYEKYIGEHNE